MTATDWLQFFALHASLSLLAVGGAMTLAPGLHRALVLDHGWLSEAQFQGCVTLAQATPGPNVLYIALAGWTSGLNAAAAAPAGGALAPLLLPPLGALLALVGVLLPSSLLACAAARWLQAHRERPLVRAFRHGMAPVVVGVMFATALLLASSVFKSADAPAHRPLLLAALALLMAASTLLVWRTRVSLLWLVAAGGVAGAGLGAALLPAAG